MQGPFFTLYRPRWHPAPCLHRVDAHNLLLERIGFEPLRETEVLQSVWGSSGSDLPLPDYYGWLFNRKIKKEEKAPFVVTQS